MKRRTALKLAKAGAIALALTGVSVFPTAAQEITLRLHQFLPPVATVPKAILKPWGESIEKASDGRIKIEHYDTMSLGGRPTDLMDQAQDGVVDLSMTLVGYTPGRFPRTEVFELPFMMTDPVSTAKAYWEMVDTDMQDSEYQGVKVLGAWVHGPGLIHSGSGVAKLEDLQGMKMRGPTRIINDLISELGAVPVGMPLPAIPEALSKGVVEATVLPWEVTPAIKLTELVDKHTEFAGDESLYTATIVLVMNKDKYDSLPDDLKAIIDAESGEKLSAMASDIMLKGDAPGRKIAVDRGNEIITLDEEEVQRWKDAAQPVYDRWIADMQKRGIDGQAYIDQARALIKKHGG